ncbi:MAG: SPOR domain-containing protein [Gammaproteobacteria bacterium]|nr:SPOR domain-containing protein [Gammaproteobacteria bacterium]MCW8928127.1 SPOR domain-containing protein [Gammaproteobacteria bacterium]MCW8959508.1 SPOR domain-containing protein [Gammaproteobacteria bacterium]MCW8972535.1 SPOR domain-containing protein [Gammaproteobacteria bacterium]MCW8993147.1 SPOR domain-containing protein [Gammaproteobacteria bacterium]
MTERCRQWCVVAVAALAGLQADIIAAAESRQAGGEPLQLADNAVEGAAQAAKPGGDEAAEVRLTAIEPSPVPADSAPREIILQGSGFVPGSRAAISRNGEITLLGPEQLRVIDTQHLALQITPGEQQSNWAVQISTFDDRHSNVLRFQVVPVSAGGKETTIGTEPAVTATPQPADKPGRGESVTLHGYEWLADQPKTNLTLQLVASNSRESLEWMASRYELTPPLARFAMERGGERLYALTLGSFTDRAAAEDAAQALPEGIEPWIRSMGSIQQVMLREAPTGTQPVGAGGGTLSAPRVRDTAWLWSQDPTHYTLQLAASVNEQAVEATMRRVSLPGEMAVVQTLRQGRRWYVLVYGSFASDTTAREAILRLPEALQKAKPWPRRFAELHDEISRATPLP